MLTKGKPALLVVAVVVLAFTFIQRSARAGTPGTSQGVALIQLGCGFTGNGSAFGPRTSYLYNGLNACDDSVGSLPTPLPSGTLYNLRVLVDGSTTDATAKFKVSLFTSAGHKAVMVCGVKLPQSNTCQDLTDTMTVNAGDTVYASISVPDSNTQLTSVAVTVEENIIE